MSAEQADVLVAAEGSLGHVTLNRPRAINALTLGMVREIDAALDRFEADPQIAAILLDGAGERGFCAGGDIVALHDAAKSGEHGPARDFWQEEYRLNARIAAFPKPIVAIMDGVVMGGGIGLAAHASHRVATERLVSAMPEVGIGFAPDVGGTWLLSRAPGELGTHLALTGARIGAADAILAGLADHHVPSDSLAALAADLRGGDAGAAIARHAAPAPDAPLAADRAWIDAVYAHDAVEPIAAALAERTEEAAVKAAAALERSSPTSLKVTLRALRAARALPTLEACLEQEYRVSVAFLDCPDFVEGVRAQVIDKDRNPAWRPARLEDVGASDVDRFFEPVEVSS